MDISNMPPVDLCSGHGKRIMLIAALTERNLLEVHIAQGRFYETFDGAI